MEFVHMPKDWNNFDWNMSNFKTKIAYTTCLVSDFVLITEC